VDLLVEKIIVFGPFEVSPPKCDRCQI